MARRGVAQRAFYDAMDIIAKKAKSLQTEEEGEETKKGCWAAGSL